MNNMEELQTKGRKVAIDIMKANVFGLILLVASTVVLLVPYFLLWPEQWSFDTVAGWLMDGWGYLLFFLLFLAGIVVHELLHGLAWSFFAPGGWRSISFGVMWKMLTPYCHCDKPMRIPGYIVGAVTPCVVLGIIPAIVGIVIGHLPTLIWGIIFIAAAAGDLWMTWLLMKENPRSMVLDHPTEAGFYILDEPSDDD